MIKKVLIFFWLVFTSSLLFAQIDEAKVARFVQKYAADHDMEESKVQQIMDNAVFKQDIIDKMERPAEGTMTWGRYRNIFIKEARIQAGLDFWQKHEHELSQVTAETGVPEEIILGILGVETFFGQRIGSYRVLDALYTLAFGFPKRSGFFTSELTKFLELSEREHIDLYSIKGSYAGAIGYCQFMPSSYLAYAKSFEAGGSANLMEVDDAIASVANYLAAHRWEGGNMVATQVVELNKPKAVISSSAKPTNTVAFYNEHGYKSLGNISPNAKAALLEFDNERGVEYWFVFKNFYVITRYNHSPLYAMAVFQLGQSIKERYLEQKP